MIYSAITNKHDKYDTDSQNFTSYDFRWKSIVNYWLVHSSRKSVIQINRKIYVLIISMMAEFIAVQDDIQQRKERRSRIFRDIINPIDYMTDVELIERYIMPRNKILEVVDMIKTSIETPTFRSHAIPAISQVWNPFISYDPAVLYDLRSFVKR